MPNQCVSGIVAAFTGQGAPVQGGSATASGASSVSYAFPNSNVGGNTLIAFVGIWGATPTTPSGASRISDSAGNAWTLINDSLATDEYNQCEVAMWYATGSRAGPNTVTVSNNAGMDFDLQVWEYPAALTALDTWGGGDFSWTIDTDSQTFYNDQYQQSITTFSNDTVIIGAYNPMGSTLKWALGVPANPLIPNTAWTQRNQSANANGETSALFDGQVAAGVSFWVTIAIPPPAITSPPVRIADLGPFDPTNPVLSYWHPNNNYKDTLIRYPIHCGHYSYLNPSSNAWNLYTVLISYGDASTGAQTTDVFKSVDSGETWNKMGTSPINTFSFASPYNTPVAAVYGDQIYVLWYYTDNPAPPVPGLFVSTFDMSSDSWTATTDVAPLTGSILAAWDLCVPAAGEMVIFWNSALDGNGQTAVWANLYSSGTWQTPAQVAMNSILDGLTFDPSTLTAYLVAEDFPGATGTGPNGIHLYAISNFAWPFTPPSPVTVSSGYPVISNYRRQPACGPLVAFLGNLYIPYTRPDYTGSTFSDTIPACFVGTAAGPFTSFDLTPNTSQGFTRPDDGGTTNTDIWATVIGHNLYIVWCENGPPNRIRTCVSSTGTFPSPVATLYDASLTMPDQLQARIDSTTGTDNASVYSLSINQVFGTGAALICQLGDPEDSGFDEAWYMPLTGAPPPPSQPLGNAFY